MSEWLKKGNISPKEMVYLILPFLLLLILFPAVVQQDHVLISEYHDSLIIINSAMSVAENPFGLWNNQWITGLPEYADPLSDHYYPFFFPLFHLTQDVFILNIVLLAHLYIAFLFFYLLAGLMTKNPEIRMISALFYIFSGVLLMRFPAGHATLIFALAWVPLLYYGFFKIVWDEELTVRNIVIVAVTLALIFFTGAVYYLFYCGLILVVFLAYYILKKRMGTGAVIAVLSAFALGGMLLAIKLIPLGIVSGALGRIDIINPLADGGSLENNLASLIFGTQIDTVFGYYESAVLIGIIPVLLVIIALVFGREDRTIPAFLAVVAAFIWADGGNILISFIHLLPGLSNFRVAGRVLGALAPLLLLFAISGFEILNTRLKSGEALIPDSRQKHLIAGAAGILILVKILELPFLPGISLEAGLSLVFIAAFAGLIYFNQATVRNILIFFTVSCLIDAAVIVRNAANLTQETSIRVLVILAIVIAVLAVFNRERLQSPAKPAGYACIFLIFGLGVALIGNASCLNISDPKLDESPAVAIIEKIRTFDNNQSQIWVYENGWSIQHMDFTYWFIKNGIHPIRAYYPYFLNPMVSPVYTIGNVTYYTPDYLIDTAYLENGDQNLENVTFKVANISVYKPDHVLPNAFVIRNNQLVPSKIEKFSSDEVTLSGDFLAGDIALLKSSFYPGWKLDGRDASNVQNMVGAPIPSAAKSVTFSYSPLDFKIAAIISGIGALIVIGLVIKRREVERYLGKLQKSQAAIPERKKKKR